MDKRIINLSKKELNQLVEIFSGQLENQIKNENYKDTYRVIIEFDNIYTDKTIIKLIYKIKENYPPFFIERIDVVCSILRDRYYLMIDLNKYQIDKN